MIKTTLAPGIGWPTIPQPKPDKRHHKAKFTPAEADEIRRLFEAGTSNRVLATRHRVTFETINNIINRLAAYSRPEYAAPVAAVIDAPPTLTKTDLCKARIFRACGWTVKSIAQRLGVNPTILSRAMLGREGYAVAK